MVRWDGGRRLFYWRADSDSIYLWIALDLLYVPFIAVAFFRSYRYVCTPCIQPCITQRFMSDASDSDYSKGMITNCGIGRGFDKGYKGEGAKLLM